MGYRVQPVAAAVLLCEKEVLYEFSVWREPTAVTVMRTVRVVFTRRYLAPATYGKCQHMLCVSRSEGVCVWVWFEILRPSHFKHLLY